ncbi:MAG: hypothetical protein AAF985_01730 [Bacteroidota bacterium]
MKKLIVLGILLFCFVHLLSAQEYRLKGGSFRVKLKMLDGEKVKGKLAAIEGDQVSIRLKGTKEVASYPFQEIKRIKVRRVGTPFIGALAGGLTFGLVSTATSNPNVSTTSEQIGQFFSLVGATFAGTIIGTVAGSVYQRYRINGDRTAFERFKKKYLRKKKQ